MVSRGCNDLGSNCVMPYAASAWEAWTECRKLLLAPVVLVTLTAHLMADEPFEIERCEVVPLANHRVSLQIDGVEKTCWNYGGQYPRPFFYPFRGPSGTTLTRMGHPGASDHDHHRSVWFAHHDVAGTDFWSDNTNGQVRQKMWFAYQDGKTEAVMASETGWFAGDGQQLLEQEVVAALIPMPAGEHALEIQITMRPPPRTERVVLGKTNFGFLAVRVAKTLSVHFGGGQITNSEGLRGEKEIFGKQARWMDYSGPVVVGRLGQRKAVTEGITYFDHPSNLRYPTYWHVRSDGWMGASFCLADSYTVTDQNPLVLRYLLHAHRGSYEHERAETVQQAFGTRPGFEVAKSSRPHRQFEVGREAR